MFADKNPIGLCGNTKDSEKRRTSVGHFSNDKVGGKVMFADKSLIGRWWNTNDSEKRRTSADHTALANIYCLCSGLIYSIAHGQKKTAGYREAMGDTNR